MIGNLRKLLSETIEAQVPNETEVGLLLSGGLDSLTVGIASADVGKRVIAYRPELLTGAQ